MNVKTHPGLAAASVDSNYAPTPRLTHSASSLPADSADFRVLVIDHTKEDFGALVEICGSLRATAREAQE